VSPHPARFERGTASARPATARAATSTASSSGPGARLTGSPSPELVLAGAHLARDLIAFYRTRLLFILYIGT
jgi:hypothetical protein